MVVLKTTNPSRRVRTALYRGPTASAAAARKPPVVLEWTDAFIRFGLAEEPQPKHVLAWESPSSGKILSESEWYSVLMPLLCEVYDRLMIVIPTRRVILLSSYCTIRSWEAALLQGLWDMGVPAVSKMSYLSTPPISLGLPRCLVIFVGKSVIECVAIVDDHVMEDTYQAVPCSALWSEKIQTKWAVDRDLFNPRDPNSLVVAILKCVEKCPIHGRKDVVGNLVFVGDACRSDLPYRTVSHLQTLLEDGLPPEESGEQKEEDPKEPSMDTIMLPTRFDELRSLSASFQAKNLEPFSPMQVSWAGASLWATAWHRHDDDGFSRIKWIFPSSGAT